MTNALKFTVKNPYTGKEQEMEANVTLDNKETETVTPAESSASEPVEIAMETPIETEPETQNQNTPFNQILHNVAIVISGIQNPERSQIRDMALHMGARYLANWTREATHLICPFENTPKYREMQNSGHGIAVFPQFIKSCHDERQLVDARRYEIGQRPESESEDTSSSDDHDHTQEDDLSETACSDNAKQTYSIVNLAMLPDLPDFFSGMKVLFDPAMSPAVRRKLTRFIYAYDGDVLSEEDAKELDKDSVIVLTTGQEAVKSLQEFVTVNSHYILKCHQEQMLCNISEYIMK